MALPPIVPAFDDQVDLEEHAEAELARLLDERNEHPESLAAIDAEIWRRFGITGAVLVLDMCGFSRLTLRYGITHFLSMIRRLQQIVRPVVTAADGRVVKTEADNVFAIFDDVPDALAAARDILKQLAAANVFLPADWDLHASIGIGYGPLLRIGEHDLFGSELNLASKLGEDVAGPEEILLSEAACARVDNGTFDVEELSVEVSSLSLRAFRVR
jgi:adenylate cyclase